MSKTAILKSIAAIQPVQYCLNVDKAVYRDNQLFWKRIAAFFVISNLSIINA